MVDSNSYFYKGNAMLGAGYSVTFDNFNFNTNGEVNCSSDQLNIYISSEMLVVPTNTVNLCSTIGSAYRATLIKRTYDKDNGYIFTLLNLNDGNQTIKKLYRTSLNGTTTMVNFPSCTDCLNSTVSFSYNNGRLVYLDKRSGYSDSWQTPNLIYKLFVSMDGGMSWTSQNLNFTNNAAHSLWDFTYVKDGKYVGVTTYYQDLGVLVYDSNLSQSKRYDTNLKDKSNPNGRYLMTDQDKVYLFMYGYLLNILVDIF